MKDSNLEQLGINVIRGLAMDAPQKANSGHPGTAMALAPLAHVLFTKVMRHDPSNPHWPDRDRFVLSVGHASILLYSMLYLCGYGLTLDDLKSFRQWESATPGHPEVHHTLGVETTTGPLGQGFATAVGMGIAERWLRARFSPELCNHYTFVLCSDGDLEEGISHEAASLAGHLGLGRLIYVYDDNEISIDGPTSLSFSDNTAERFRAYGWDVDEVGEIANDTQALEKALRRAMSVEDKPSIIILKSHIGWPSPNKVDTSSAHGDPFGEAEIKLTKEILGIPPEEDFWVPQEVIDMYRQTIERGQKLSQEWEQRLASYTGDKQAWQTCQSGRGIPGWQQKLPSWKAGEKIATRKAIGACLAATADVIPGLLSGGADLTGNTGTRIPEASAQSAASPDGRQIYYGIREHAMGAIMNGMALHGGALPLGGTFFIFSDYMRPAVRLAALSDAHVIYSWTHDSIGLGEDGPTHQPIEHLASIRAMPGLRVIRPADANECAQAWRIAVDSNGPTALILSRQDLPVLEQTSSQGEEVDKGAYVLHRPDKDEEDIVIIGTGSEVHICIQAAKLLADKGISARVVSMPSWDLFAAQSKDYQNSVLPVGIPTLAVEAGVSFGWERYADATISIDRFGSSAPGAVNMERFGFNAENVVQHCQNLINSLS